MPPTKPTPAGTDELILDFSEVKPFEPLDSKRKYLAQISVLDISKSQSGSPKSHCEMTIMGPDEVLTELWEPDEDAEGGMKFVGLGDKSTKAAGRRLFREFSLQQQALPFLYQMIKAVNPSAVLDDSFKYKPEDYLGLTLCVTIQNEAYEEQIRSRVNRMYPEAAYNG